jgi:hypothetical protein
MDPSLIIYNENNKEIDLVEMKIDILIEFE